MCKLVDEDKTHTRTPTTWEMLNLKNKTHTESANNNANKMQPCSAKDHPQRHANLVAKTLQDTSLSSSLHNSPMFSTSNIDKR